MGRGLPGAQPSRRQNARPQWKQRRGPSPSPIRPRRHLLCEWIRREPFADATCTPAVVFSNPWIRRTDSCRDGATSAPPPLFLPTRRRWSPFRAPPLPSGRRESIERSRIAPSPPWKIGSASSSSRCSAVEPPHADYRGPELKIEMRADVAAMPGRPAAMARTSGSFRTAAREGVTLTVDSQVNGSDRALDSVNYREPGQQR